MFVELPFKSNPIMPMTSTKDHVHTADNHNMGLSNRTVDTAGETTTSYTQDHHRAAVCIQSLWRGYATRNIDPRVQKMKHELRSRRLEETLTFVIGEMNR